MFDGYATYLITLVGRKMGGVLPNLLLLKRGGESCLSKGRETEGLGEYICMWCVVFFFSLHPRPSSDWEGERRINGEGYIMCI